MKYIKNIKEDKIFKFSEYEPTKYNGTILVQNMMEWLRAYAMDYDIKDEFRISLIKFLDETKINKDQLKTFIDEQEKSSKLNNFKIKIEKDINTENIIFYDFKKNPYQIEKLKL